ncbi:MAG: hypothetical protein OXP09_02640 [Gammaproteobacteria bacterium]|nr:hypothetical protein [Gammaproteobacteria bacterium]MDE0364452.1 hypothetical protein [Gammaproteobacteria bacterium]
MQDGHFASGNEPGAAARQIAQALAGIPGHTDSLGAAAAFEHRP